MKNASNNRRYGKRHRPEWKDTPAFLDAAASVSVSTFGARRLPEIKSLLSAEETDTYQREIDDEEYKSGAGKSSNRHLRRRATSHKPYRRHRYPAGKKQCTDGKRRCRRERRKPRFLKESHKAWNHKGENGADKVNWIRTHLWHAKRFHMCTLWGWKVPMLHVNRGARASLRMAREGKTLLQDVTWAGQPIVVSSYRLETLLSCLRRICPQMMNAKTPTGAVLSGCLFVDGALYEPDQSPLGAIGPASWWITTSRSENDTKRWSVHFWIHPSICSQLENALDVVFSSERDIVITSLSLARLQVRGAGATSAVRRALNPTDNAHNETKAGYNWHSLCGDSVHKLLPHGTVLSVKMQTQAMPVAAKIAEEEGIMHRYVQHVQDVLSKFHPQTDEGCFLSMEDDGAMLISRNHCNDRDLLHNSAVCGWDIICSPERVEKFFLALTLYGGACAIGFLDEIAACLESEPPLPVFPRDFPDTAEGRRYWTLATRESKAVRHCLEEGGGRVNFPKESQGLLEQDSRLQPFDWSNVTRISSKSDIAESETIVVVVRGEFGAPFLQAILGYGTILRRTEDSSANGSRRRRRRVRAPYENATNIPLSHERLQSHMSVCATLMESLSLPALLSCHVLMTNGGTVKSGRRISVVSSARSGRATNVILGMTIAGDFSNSRGRCHGLGFVGAARLLQHFCQDPQDVSTSVVLLPGGKRQIELNVVVDQHEGPSPPAINATLSLCLS